MTSYGTRTGIIGKLLYEGGKITGIADRNDTQVISYEYNGDLISAVSDADNRRVEYSYTSERESLGDVVTFCTYERYSLLINLIKQVIGDISTIKLSGVGFIIIFLRSAWFFRRFREYVCLW